VAVLDPFRAVLYAPGVDPALVTSPPYDVISESERRRLESLHPHNIIRIILGADLPGDLPGSDKYARARGLFRDWLASGILVAERQPRLYAYTMTPAGGRPSGGVIGALRLEPLGQPDGPGGIYPHERVLPKPRTDRLDLTRAVQANLEPIWLVGGAGVIGRAVTSAAARPALVDFRDPAGTRHQLWPLAADEAAPLAGGLHEPLVIADGHHRYSASLAFRDEMRANEGPGPWDATLALVSDPGEEPPRLLPIYRITSLPLDAVGAWGDLQPVAGDLPALAARVAEAGPGTIGVATSAGQWTMAIDPPALDAPDTAWVLRHLPEGCPVTYEHDLGQVAAAVAAGHLAILPAPIPIGFVMEAALAGHVMPPKSTLFWPKPRTGILLRDFQRP
jgi:uncharacterized protein (DUF1015 family)